MKEQTFLLIALFTLMIGVVGISVAEVIKSVNVATSDDYVLMQSKGYFNLPYSKITCDDTCSYYILRADKKEYRDLETKDLSEAEKRMDADIQKYYDENLAKFKSEQKDNEIEGVIKPTGAKPPKEASKPEAPKPDTSEPPSPPLPK